MDVERTCGALEGRPALQVHLQRAEQVGVGHDSRDVADEPVARDALAREGTLGEQLVGGHGTWCVRPAARDGVGAHRGRARRGYAIGVAGGRADDHGTGAEVRGQQARDAIIVAPARGEDDECAIVERGEERETVMIG